MRANHVPAAVSDGLGSVDGLLGISFLTRFELWKTSPRSRFRRAALIALGRSDTRIFNPTAQGGGAGKFGYETSSGGGGVAHVQQAART